MSKFIIEGLQNGQWDALNVADSTEAATFDTETEAESAIDSLADSAGFDRSEMRVTEID